MLKFDLPKNQSSIIKVIGVGGGGSNAVSHMFQQGIQGVDFIICNTDAQALESSEIPTKIQLGEKGLGAGSIPDVGREAASENLEEIKQLLDKNTKMLFITAGMGGGTGTGAAPVIAQLAREMDILTVGIVTIPFSFEGRKRKQQAEAGIEELRKNVDSLLIICNDKLREVHGDLKLSEAFNQADNVLTVAAKGIAEIITVTGYINVDFEDVKTVMHNSGTAIMGSAMAEGENRAIKAIEEALTSPLLNDNHIKGANDILLYLASGDAELTMDEVTDITDYIQEEAGQNAEIIWGNGIDTSLGNKISVTLVATGFESEPDTGFITERTRKVHNLTVGPREEVSKPTPSVSKPVTEITLLRKGEVKLEETVDTKEEVEMSVEEPLEEIRLISKTQESEPKQEKEHQPQVNSSFEKKEATEKKLNILNSESQEIKKVNKPFTLERQEIERKSTERIRKLKDLSLKLRTPQEIDEMERVPAYLRRNVDLPETKHSSESEVSRYTLGDNDNPGEMRSNSFLHDAVD